MSVIVVATIVPVPEHRSEVISAIEDAIASAHANDEGCELYALHEGTDRLVMIEKWADQGALEAHGRSPAVAQLLERTNSKVAGEVDIQVLTPHPAGTPQQGIL
jgi:quinol monooxygenase YgiN